MKKIMPDKAYSPSNRVRCGKPADAGEGLMKSSKVSIEATKRIRRPVTIWIKSGLLLLIRLYQLIISPVMHSSCRFYPTCSVYAYQSIERHGVLKGSALAMKRLARCNPFGGRGYDPVP